MKCIHPDKPCPFRDDKGYCNFKCTYKGNCEHKMIFIYDGTELVMDCSFICVYELPDECPIKRKLIKEGKIISF